MFMVLEDCVEERLRKIDERAYECEFSEKRVVHFIADFVNSNYEDVLRVFFPVIEDAFRKYLEGPIEKIGNGEYAVVRKNFMERALYFEVAGLIGRLYDMRGDGVGSIFDDKPEVPEVQLGLAEYFKHYGSEHFGRRLTQRGRDLANSYAEIAKNI